MTVVQLADLMTELAKTKVHMQFLSGYFLHWTPTFGWCVIRNSSKNGYQNDMCWKDIELHAQMLIVPQ